MKAEERIRIGLVGASWFSDLWYLPVITKHPRAALAAVCSESGESAKRMAERYEAGAAYSSYDEMFSKESLDGVCIVTPNDAHAPAAQAAMKHGLHVLCEKPLARSLSEARDMLEKAERSGIIHGINFTYREHPGIAKMKSLRQEGLIGNVVSGSFEYSGDYGMSGPPGWRGTASRGGAGGVLADLGSHLIDLAQFVTEDRITQVCGDVYVSGADRRSDPAADAVTFLARFSAGVRGMFHTSWLEPQGSRRQTIRLELTGDRGKIRFAASELGSMLQYALHRHNWVTVQVEGTVPWAEDGVPSEANFRPWRLTERNEVWKWIDRIIAGKYGNATAVLPIPSFRDGCEVQAVMEAVLRSDEQKTWVNVPVID